MFFIFYKIQQVIDKSPNQQIIFCILKKVRTFTEILVHLTFNPIGLIYERL